MLNELEQILEAYVWTKILPNISTLNYLYYKCNYQLTVSNSGEVLKRDGFNFKVNIVMNGLVGWENQQLSFSKG